MFGVVLFAVEADGAGRVVAVEDQLAHHRGDATDVEDGYFNKRHEFIGHMGPQPKVAVILILGEEVPETVVGVEQELGGEDGVNDDALATAGDEAVQPVALPFEGAGGIVDDLESYLGPVGRIDVF